MSILPVTMEPLVRRLLAPNPSPFTYTGTETYIVGRGEVGVIDPGPALPEHVDAILAATGGERIRAILCTHTHRDHSPASRALRAMTGAPIVGCAALTMDDDGPRSDAAFDADYRPDRVLADGETVSGAGWTLEAVATPGHTSNHLCFALRESKALFSGDHIMGWSTTVVSPPDGDMDAYLASLEKVQARDFATLWPTHGPPVTDVRAFIDAYRAHRMDREAQIIARLQAGQTRIKDMVPVMYADVDSRLYPAAAHSVLAHMIRLVAIGRVRCDGAPGLASAYSLIP